MSNILINWLNDEVRLTQPIHTLDDCSDFIDGYLIGQILSKYNQQSDFNEFKNENSPKSKVNNFCMLSRSLRAIDVHFDSKIATNIMNGDPSTVKRLLYDIKTSLDRIKRSNIQSKSLSAIKPDATGKLNLTSVVPQTKPLFEKAIDISFKNSIRNVVENPKELVMAKVTQRFEAKKTQLFNSSSYTHNINLLQADDERHQYSDQLRSRKRHEKLFQDAWNHMNKDQWRINQKIAHDRRELKRKVLLMNQLNKDTKSLQKRWNDREYTLKSIDQFDRKLENDVFRGEESDTDDVLKASILTMSNADRKVDKGTVNELLTTGFQRTQNIIIDHHENIEKSRQLRSRHRSKFIAEQESIYHRLVHYEGDNAIHSQLLNKCTDEVNEQEDKESILIYQKIVETNRKNRDDLISKLVDTSTAIDNDRRAENLRREYDWIIVERIESQSSRVNTLEEAHNSADLKQTEEFVGSLIDRLLDITDWVVSYKTFGLYSLSNSDPEGITGSSASSIPAFVWSDAKRVFESDLNISRALPYPISVNDSTTLPYVLSDKPLCFDSDYLFAKPFDTCNVVESDIYFQSYMDSESSAVVTTYLSQLDMKEYFDDIKQFRIDENLNSKLESVPAMNKKASVSTLKKRKSVSEIYDVSPSENFLHAPSWITTAKEYNLLGDIVLAVNVLVNPIPDVPSSPEGMKDLNQWPVRMALYGVSEIARKKITETILRDIQGLKVINTEAIIGDLLSAENESSLASKIQSCLRSGDSIPDHLYLEMIVNEIQSLDKALYPLGFILDDYPANKKQALILFKALSGIDYSSHRPQAIDRQSSLLSCSDKESIQYDPVLCGLNKVFVLKSSTSVVSQVIQERAMIRDNYLAQSQEFLDSPVAFTPDMADVIAEVYCPSRPQHVSGIDAYEQEQRSTEFEELLTSMGLVDVIYDDGYCFHEDTANSISHIIQGYIPIQLFPNEKGKTHEECLGSEESSLAQQDDMSIVSNDQDHVLHNENIDTEQNISISIQKITLLPEPLAIILHNVWTNAEIEAQRSCHEFFGSLRDIKHLMSQRRRIVHDLVSVHLISKDNRQHIFEEFRDRMNNGIEHDLRYDIDCKSELLLRAQELGDTFIALSDSKKTTVDTLLTSLASDGKIQLLVHRSRCEAVAFIQSELNRFFNGVNLVLDYVKAMTGYEPQSIIANALEAAIPLTNDERLTDQANKSKPGRQSVAGQSKDLKSKKLKEGDSAPVTRKLVAPSIVSESLMNEENIIQHPNETELKASNTKKSKGKETKAPDESEAINPLDTTIQSALSIIAEFSSDKFVINRTLYNNDGILSAAIEKCIWYEAEKLRYQISRVKETVTHHCEWLESCEKELISTMSSNIKTRYMKEISVTMRLVDMIGEVIMNNSPIREEWLIASDAIAIIPDRFVHPHDPPPLTPIVEPTLNHLNEEQKQVLQNWINSVKIGDYILEQDLDEIFERSLSIIGPLCSTICLDSSSTIQSLRHLTIPRAWRDAYSAIALQDNESVTGKDINCKTIRLFREKIMGEQHSRPGTDEHSGVYTSDDVLTRLSLDVE